MWTKQNVFDETGGGASGRVQEKLKEIMPGRWRRRMKNPTYEYPLRVLLPAGKEFPASFLEAVQKYMEA